MAGSNDWCDIALAYNDHQATGQLRLYSPDLWQVESYFDDFTQLSAALKRVAPPSIADNTGALHDWNIATFEAYEDVDWDILKFDLISFNELDLGGTSYKQAISNFDTYNFDTYNFDTCGLDGFGPDYQASSYDE